MSEIDNEHSRIKNIIGPIDPYFGRYSIGIFELLEAHFLLIKFFKNIGEGVGGVGPKNMHLLHSALSRQFVEFGGKPKWTERIDVCSTLMYGIVKNHPFHDANKRTAFLTSLLHLQKIGRTPSIDGQLYEDFVVDIANNNLSSYAENLGIDNKSEDFEIKTISQFLKKNTRNIDLKNKVITFNEMASLLSKRGYKIESPNNNKIGVFRIKDETGNSIVPRRVAVIGFPGWSKQVAMRDIDIVREATRLDAKHGYDAQSFFNGVDDPMTLISKYKEPLERLAFR